MKLFRTELTPPLVAISAVALIVLCGFPAGAAGLPEGYTRVENIIFSNGQSITVPHGAMSNVGCKMLFNISSRGGEYGPHLVNSDANGAFWVVARLTGGNGLMVKYSGKETNLGAMASYSNGTGVGVDTLLDLNTAGDGKAYVNGSEVSFGVNTGTSLSAGNFCLCNYISQSTSASFGFCGTLGYVKFYSAGTLVVDLVPCKDPEGRAGFYDVLSESPNAFYTGNNSAAATRLKAGKEVADISENLQVASAPLSLVQTDPPNGPTNVPAGTTLRLTAPMAWTNATGDCRAELDGWKLYESEDGASYVQVDAGPGVTPYDYLNDPAKCRRFEWQWRYYYMVEAAACAPAQVTPRCQWTLRGEVAEMTAEPLRSGTNLKWESSGGTENGTVTGRIVRAKIDAAQAFKVLPYREDEVQTFEPFLTNDWQAVAEGFASVRDVVIIGASLNGAGFGQKDVPSMAAIVTEAGGAKTFQFQSIHGGWHKCVEVSVKVENGVLFAKVNRTGYTAATDFKAGEIPLSFGTMTGVQIATATGEQGYGLRRLVFAPRLKPGLVFLVR